MPEKTLEHSLYVHEPGVIYLARALPERMFDDKNAFEFFRGLDSAGNPLWGGITEKQPVFEDPNGVGWCFSAGYNHILRRYVLSTEHTVSKQGVMGVFDAPEPWGPWTTIRYYDESEYFGKSQVVQNVFFLCFPTKWLSRDGNEFTMVFTGAGNGKNNDSFNTVDGKFILKP